MLEEQSQIRPESLLQRYSVVSYFVLTFSVSWAGALAVALPSLLRRAEIPRLSGILMFPAMLLGPLVSGLVMARVVNGRGGAVALLRGMFVLRVKRMWLTALLLPPLLVFVVLIALSRVWSPTFAPNHFWLGVAFGVPAGICEEIGWTGFAFPRMRSQRSALSAAIVLGLLWSLWHLPAFNFLGAAAPHGHYWLQFFFAFALAMTAMRVLISWVYTNTRSLLLAQLMHVSSTGALVIFSPAVTPMREATWYALYGCTLWIIVIIVAMRCGRDLEITSRS